MNPPASPETTPDRGALRRRLADRLAAAGDLRSPPWRAAVESVPREVFAPEWFERVDTEHGTMWSPVLGDAATPERVYEDTTLVTQLDDKVRPRDVAGPVFGTPSSSSTLPGLVVGMLEDLRVEDGDRVLEIGSGTGYSTALLARRLGDDRVTSIEVDPETARRAASALKATGLEPHLVVGDGLDGVPDRAPYDRLIATCSVREIPRPWLEQSRPGTIVLANLTGWLYAFGQTRLTVTEPGHAIGEFLPGTVSFMVARRHAPPGLDTRAALAADTPGRPTDLGPAILRDWAGRFVVQGALPTAQHVTMQVGNGPFLDHLLDADGSHATLLPQQDGSWNVREGGPRRLWNLAEQAVTCWRAQGAPPVDAFRMSITPDRQTIHLPDDSLTWELPHS
ncbi:ATP-grasp peptide maturase system methyltransferase [Embleya sp. NPDC127516]|uniref:ATP-grasp peptide maturase system methyltransferase n=1 Tax=Embleya sp. NPDC127516 TaxID=3363990 RepID=UPI0038193F32